MSEGARAEFRASVEPSDNLALAQEIDAPFDSVVGFDDRGPRHLPQRSIHLIRAVRTAEPVARETAPLSSAGQLRKSIVGCTDGGAAVLGGRYDVNVLEAVPRQYPVIRHAVERNPTRI